MAQAPEVDAALTQLDQRIERLRALAPKTPPPQYPPLAPRPGLATRWGRGLILTIFLFVCWALLGIPIGIVAALGQPLLTFLAAVVIVPLGLYSVVRGLVFEFRHWWEEDPPATPRHRSAVDGHDSPGTIGGASPPRSSPAS